MKAMVDSRFLVVAFVALIPSFFSVGTACFAQQREIPEALKPWIEWATWNDGDRDSPPAFDNAQNRTKIWPSRLALTVGPQKAEWKISIKAFNESWVPLPGSSDVWPQNVFANGEQIAVVEHDERPSVKVPVGLHELSGEFAWTQMPQRIAIPKQIGLINLIVDGTPIAIPDWDDDGYVWLKRERIEAAEANSITAQVFRVIEDGIPNWLRTDIELTVSGKSREEELGWILPEGWNLATIESRIPVAIDELGRMKAQVRAGKWTVSVSAFRTNDARDVHFAQDTTPITNMELIAFKANPEFRLAELIGLQPVDVAQTAFPEKWRGLPLYQWDTRTTIQIEEKMRGMGMQSPAGLTINRRIWMDEDGDGMTYNDVVNGNMQQIWRLDASEGQELGAVRVNGQSQLITTNPSNGAPGVEIRSRNVNLNAIGRLKMQKEIAATGWQTDADSLQMTLNLPPGWRVFALFGADRVEGDWLTSWSLLDLFLLLIFGAAMFRMFGFWAGLVAFLAFGLAYHEPGSPRITWLFLLMPVALLRLVKEGTAMVWIKVWKYVAVAFLLINLIPFLAMQIQNTLYPQLESPGTNFASRSMFRPLGFAYRTSTGIAERAYESYDAMPQTMVPGQQESKAGKWSQLESSNLLYDPKARIQTGPAQPEWSWNLVDCYWDGPVSADQKIKPIFISLNQNRIISVFRIAMLILLSVILLGGKRRIRFPFFGRNTKTALMIIPICFATSSVMAQEIPDAEMLNTLRERLLQPGDAFPHAAEIPSIRMKVDGNRVVMDSEVHTAMEVAVPMPGKLPDWSPVSMTVDGKPAELICRKNGYLWTVLPKGVHHVVVESMLPDVSEWEWTFLLKPRTVSIDAPGWTVTGVSADGAPEQQVFFVRQQQIVQGAAAYDRKDFNAIVAVDRHLETGLVWQVRTEVTRLSGTRKALSIKVPLLTGESVLTPNLTVENGFMEVRFGVGQESFSWTSELPRGKDVQLMAPETDQWVERWHLITSPVWNVSGSGLAPIFESKEEKLIPVWHPWPKEEVKLTFTEPKAIIGDTITVQRVQYKTELGLRQRAMQLEFELESSLGGSFPVALDAQADITSLIIDGQVIPARRDGRSLIIPVHPGHQTIQIAWRTYDNMATVVQTAKVEIPFDAANITSLMQVPESRWVLWTNGPTRGPAVRFWTVLVFAILAAWMLGSLKDSPLGRFDWILLLIGLTQVHISAAMFVVLWLFVLAWRRKVDPASVRYWWFNLRQIGLVLMTLIALGILIVVVGAGLLGNPEMFILGNGSSAMQLQWFQPRTSLQLPEPFIVSVSVWYYRLLMLFWALWLAFALLRWLNYGWKSFTQGGGWLRRPFLATSDSLNVDVNPKT